MNDENTDWFRHGVDLDKARQLFKESGYNGEPVTVLQATNIAYMSNNSQLIAGQLRKIGVNAQLAPSDWGGVVTRRAVRPPDNQGGWDIFVTGDSDYSHSDPIGLATFQANGVKAWYGWPKSDEFEALRASGRIPIPSTNARRWRARCRKCSGTSCRLCCWGGTCNQLPTAPT